MNPPDVPDHTLLRPIGRGAYGEVWLARNVMGALRAVKIIWRQQFDSDRPFQREFDGIQRFEPVSRSADGLVHVLHVGRNDAEGYFYYVMELADDAVAADVKRLALADLSETKSEPPDVGCYEPRTLRSDLKRHGRLSTAVCLRLALDVVSGLERLHRQGLVHRDVKPGNIIFVEGRAKLADLGLVSADGTLETLRQAGAIRVTPEVRGATFVALALPDLRVDRAVNLGPDVTSFAYDSDFGRYAVAHGRGTVEVYSQAGTNLLLSLPAATNLNSRSLLFSPAGRYLAFKRDHGAGNDSALEVWDLAATQRVFFAPHAVAFDAFTFHPYHSRLLMARPDGLLVDWDLAGNRKVAEWPSASIRSLSYSPDGGRFAAARKQRVEVRDTASGTLQAEALFSNVIYDVDWHPAGRQVAAVGDLSSVLSPLTASISGNLDLNGVTHAFDVADGSPDCDLTISAVISNGGITKTGAGRLCASGNSTYTGLITVGAGFLRVDSDNALGSASGGTTVSPGATLSYAAAPNSVPEHVTLNGHGVGKINGALNASGTVTQFGSVTLQSAATIRTESGAQFSIPSVIDGSGDLTKAGPGTLTFNGVNANTYLGQTRVEEGWLQLGKVGQVSIPGPVTIRSGPPERLSARLRYLAGASFAVAGSFTVNEASLLDLNGQSESFWLPGVPLTLNDGGDVQTGAGLLTLRAGSTVVVNPGTIGSSSITGRLGLDASLALGDNQTFEIGSGGAGVPLTISASMEATTARAANVIKTGPGELWLNGGNTFAGSLSVNEGRVTLGSSTAAGAPGGGVFVNNGGVLAMAASIGITGDPLTLNSTSPVPFTVVSGISDWDSTITLNRDATINVSSGASLGIYYGFAGSGRMTKIGDGMLQLRGSVGTADTNTITVAAGTLILDTTPSVQAINGPLIIGDGVGGADADVVRLLRVRQIGNRVPVTINSSGLLDLNGLSDAFGALSGNGHVSLNGGILEANYPDATSTFDGIISGAGDFYKDGTGTLTLNGNNTYTGTTVVYSDPTVGGGTLLVNGSQPQSPVVISNGCTLGGSGTVGSISVGVGGTVSPGSSAGILTANGGVTFNSGSTYRVELNGTTPGSGYDQLDVLSGSVQLGGATLSATLGFQSASNNTFTIINKRSGSQINGTFNGLPQNATLTINGILFRISYSGGTGNDVVITQLQSPPSLASMQLSGGNLQFSWPSNYPGFILESNTNLNYNFWTLVTPPPVITGTNYAVTNSMTVPQKFFRLRFP